MKTIRDIESLSPEELERIGDDSSVKVPEGLSDSILEAIAAESEVEKRGKGFPYRLALASAAAAAAVAAVAVPTLKHQAIHDTYDDPMLAYAQVEETFRIISGKMSSTIEKTMEASEIMEKPSEIFERINSKNDNK